MTETKIEIENIELSFNFKAAGKTEKRWLSDLPAKTVLTFLTICSEKKATAIPILTEKVHILKLTMHMVMFKQKAKMELFGQLQAQTEQKFQKTQSVLLQK